MNRTTPIVQLMRFSIILLICFILLPSHVFAVGEFAANYAVQYAVSPAGVTIVTQNITLTNKISNLYPQKYVITIDSTRINNILAYDKGGMIKPTITRKDNKTEINLTFNQKVAGIGKSLEFSLRYEDLDIAQKNGSIWEINIPGIENDPDVESYYVSLNVSPTFGNNAYTSPLPSFEGKWTKEQMLNGGISAAYGDVQSFDMDLTYHVDNSSITQKQHEIALPPDTEYQKILIRSLDPKPKTVVRDADGNWLAQYDVLPAQKIDIHAQITALIYLTPEVRVPVIPFEAKDYTKPLQYWEAADPKIMQLAAQFKTPRDIYTFVSKTLAYNYTRINDTPIRKGAVESLENPRDALCMEFTDLFIAIARAAGIPAREVIGYAFTNNARLRPLSLIADVLHAWPEYYDTQKNIWVPIDPTWANTTGGMNYFDKLDFNHITFAVLGKSSTYPYPAGFYKKTGKITKDIFVQFSQAVPVIPEGHVAASYRFPTTVSSGITAHGSVIVQNTSEVTVPKTEISIHTTPVDIALTKSFDFVPPYSSLDIPISIPIRGFFLTGQGEITTVINGQTVRSTYDIVPLFQRFIFPIILMLIALLSAILLIFQNQLIWKRLRR